MIEAAGGVVWRSGTDGLEVLLVHRPHRQDWSLPKGRRRRDERPLECALREVREETGLRCVPGIELPQARYVDRKGRPRRVRYWTMQGVRGRFRPNDEVDAVSWTPFHHLGEILTHAHELEVVRGLATVRVEVA